MFHVEHSHNGNWLIRCGLERRSGAFRGGLNSYQSGLDNPVENDNRLTERSVSDRRA